MRSIVLLITFLVNSALYANIVDDFFNGECVNFDQLRYEINDDLDSVDSLFFIKGTFSDRYDGKGSISLNLFDNQHCSGEYAGYFHRSWNNDMFYCSSGGVSSCYRRRGLYKYMTELLLETLRHHRFKFFCIGSFAETNNKMYNSIEGSEEEKILATAIGKTVISYFGRNAIVQASRTNQGYCIEISESAWN